MHALKSTRFGTQKSGHRDRQRHPNYDKEVKLAWWQIDGDDHGCLVFEADRQHHYLMDHADATSVVKCILSGLPLEYLTALQIEFAARLQEATEQRLANMNELILSNKKNVKELFALKKKLASLSG